MAAELPSLPTLIQNPEKLSEHRVDLFNPGGVFILPYEVHRRVWPYVSNIWSISNRATRPDDGGGIREYWQCRWYREPDPSRASGAQRSTRWNFQATRCHTRLLVRITPILVGYHMTLDDDGNPIRHSHSLRSMDEYRINDAVKEAVCMELAKGYSPASVFSTFLSRGQTGAFDRLEEAGGQFLERTDIRNWQKGLEKTTLNTRNNDRLKISQTDNTWVHEVQACQAYCTESGLRFEQFIERNQAGEDIPGFVWAKDSRLMLLSSRGYLTLFDSTHKTNRKEWKLFTWVVRSEVGVYVPCASALIDGEDGNAIAKAITIVRSWLRSLSLEWNCQYILTDDSAAEQRAIRLAFSSNNPSIYGTIEHLICRWHAKQTLDRNLSGDILSKAKEHLMAALFSRRTYTGCHESVQAALDSIPDGTIITRNRRPWDPKAYIEREWRSTIVQWANYNREKEYILLQISTTGACESWHATLKSALKLTKNANSKWSFLGVLRTFEDCARIIDLRVEKARNNWKNKEVSLCERFEWLRNYPFPAQLILSDNIKAAEARQMEESQAIRAPDAYGECDCKAFRTWHLPCEHMIELWEFVGDVEEPNWAKYAGMFADGGLFEVYEGKRVIIREIEAGNDSQGADALNRALNRGKLDLDEVSNRIKDRRFFLEDKIRQAGVPPTNAARIMRAFTRAYATAIEHLQSLSIDELLRFND